MHGSSQAVRLPKEFRLPGKEVKVSRVGDAVLLEPIVEQKPFGSESLLGEDRRDWSAMSRFPT